MKRYLLLSLVLISFFSFSQNLIKNAGFEEVDCGKSAIAGLVVKTKEGVCRVKEWDNATSARSDLFLSDTANVAKEGKYCAGFTAYGTGGNNREYLVGSIAKPLLEGHTYIFRMNVKISSRSTHIAFNIGAYFAPNKIKNPQSLPLNYKPQVVSRITPDDYITTNTDIRSTKDLIPWNGGTTLTIQGSFVAMGDEKFVVIGNFDNDKVIVSAPVFPIYAKVTKAIAYYLIDDVSLEEDKTKEVVKIVKPLISKKEMKVGSSIILKDITFSPNSAVLRTGAGETLTRLLETLNTYPKLVIEIGGHNDFTGKENAQLSEARAKAVADFLISSGINATRLTVKGYGSTNPVSFYNNEKEQAKNRRVEIKIVKL
jgi:OmpA-OmpF porin, OOP family